MKLSILDSTLAVCKLDPNNKLPEWATKGSFYSITRTPEELSIVCDSSIVPEDVVSEKNWKAFKVQGPLDFGLTGILAAIANPLAQAKISIFAVSTFDTDYVLVKMENLARASDILKANGFLF